MSDVHRIAWHGDGAKDHVRDRIVRFLTRAAIVVKTRAQELLSVPGTGTLRADTYKQERARVLRALRRNVQEYNKRHKEGIRLGKLKRLRVTKQGRISGRRKPRKSGGGSGQS